jgi:hypothetical protein
VTGAFSAMSPPSPAAWFLGSSNIRSFKHFRDEPQQRNFHQINLFPALASVITYHNTDEQQTPSLDAHEQSSHSRPSLVPSPFNAPRVSGGPASTITPPRCLVKGQTLLKNFVDIIASSLADPPPLHRVRTNRAELISRIHKRTDDN